SLGEWDRERTRSSAVLRTTCISQLSLLACVGDMWPNAIRHAAIYPPPDLYPPGSPSWPKLLCDVIGYFPNDRIVQAAWTVLARVAGRDVAAEDLWAAIRCSMKDRPLIRERMLALLSSVEGRSQVVALSADSIREALGRWTTEPSGQTLLATARMLAILAREPGLDGQLRQDIQSGLRMLATHPDSHLRLFRLTGTGGKEGNAFTLVGEGFLGEELRTLDSELLAHLASGLSSDARWVTTGAGVGARAARRPPPRRARRRAAWPRRSCAARRGRRSRARAPSCSPGA